MNLRSQMCSKYNSCVHGIRISITLILLLLSSKNAIPQPYYFRHYEVESGLSNNTVFCCVQDKDGFIWIGTKDGLDRFNGYDFDVFGNTAKGKSGLIDGYIRSLYADQKGTMYIGTRIGIYKYLPETETFIRIIKTDHEVNDIKEDTYGNIWAVSGKDLIRYNVLSKRIKIYHFKNHPAPTSVCITPDQNVWIATADGFLEKWQPHNDSFKDYRLFAHQSKASPKWIEKIFATKQGKILVGTSNFGIKLFDPINATHKDLLTTNKEENSIYARDFIQKSDSEIWIATESGIFIYHEGSSHYTNLVHAYNNPYSLSDNAVYTLCLDQEGGIWAGTYSGGINYYHPRYSIFEKFFPNNSKTSLPGNVVREICPDNEGNIWIGTEDAGLNKLDVKRNRIISYHSSNLKGNISYPNIHGLLVDGRKLLIGTFEHGMDIMEIKTGRIMQHYPNNGSRQKPKSDFIVTLYRMQNGTIYAGTRTGLYSFNLTTGNFSLAHLGLANCFVHTMMEDKDGKLWIGTMGNGLFCFDSETKTIRNVNNEFHLLQSAGGEWITTIFRDTHYNLWIGTEGSGLFCYHPKKNTCESYSSGYGFPGNTIYKILEDEQNNLWITTSKGLINFNPTTKSIIKIYTTANGLLSDQFNYNSGYKDPSGRMYFGSVKGMISFNPKKILVSDYAPPVFIMSITTNQGKMNASNIENISLKYASTIRLPYDKSSFSIAFAALSYIAPEMTCYRYTMDGLDKGWNTLLSNQKIFYTNLPPGTYTFRVQASNVSGKWNGKTATITIEVMPPFWQSSIAYFLYFLLLSGLLYFLFRNYHAIMLERTRRKLEFMEHEREKEAYKAKIDFLTNIAHEIRTPLTLIKAPLEKITKQMDLFPTIRKYIAMMHRNTERMVSLSQELLDFRKTEVHGFRLNLMPVDLKKFLEEITAHFKESARLKGLSMVSNFEKIPLVVNIDKEAFTKIISNLLDNAVKYAKHQIRIEAFSPESSQNMVTIIFSNDGEKISEDMSEKIFEPFFRLESAKHFPGTGLGLALSRSLTVLHNGSLKLIPSEDKFNIFVLNLPIGNDAR